MFAGRSYHHRPAGRCHAFETTTPGPLRILRTATRGSRDTLNANDNIYQGGGNQMMLELTSEGGGYRSSMDIGVQTS